MAQRQFRTDDTSAWTDRYGDGSDGAGSSVANVQTSFRGRLEIPLERRGQGTGFAAGNLVLIHQSRNGGGGSGVWELNKISSVGVELIGLYLML